jgi:2-dehydro-3-deoxygluconokinase
MIQKGGRLGIYFLETGSSYRPSSVIYDRDNSCISNADLEDFNWKEILKDFSWFHVSGITPALSEKAYKVTLEGMRIARELGLNVSMDINYRNKLWNYGRKPEDVLQEMTSYSNILIANEEHVRKFLNISVHGYDFNSEFLPDEYFLEMCENLKSKFDNLDYIALTKRRTYSSDINDFSSLLYDAKKKLFYVSRKYHMENIVDRVGGGDAFTGGLIYGLINYESCKDALEFATATACLKHTIPGDVAILRKSDVEALVKNNSARIQR